MYRKPCHAFGKRAIYRPFNRDHARDPLIYRIERKILYPMPAFRAIKRRTQKTLDRALGGAGARPQRCAFFLL